MEICVPQANITQQTSIMGPIPTRLLLYPGDLQGIKGISENLEFFCGSLRALLSHVEKRHVSTFSMGQITQTNRSGANMTHFQKLSVV